MNSLGNIQNRQEPAQKTRSFGLGSCNGANACQSLSQADALSPRFAVVRRNHNPSPSSPRFQTFWSEPGFFCARAIRCANPRALRVGGLAPRRDRRSTRATHTTDQGSETCKSQNYSQGSAWPLCWPGASGTILNVQARGRQPGLSSRASATAMCLPGPSSARVLGRCATTLGPAEAAADQSGHYEISMTRQLCAHRENTPARGFASGGFFVANPRGSAPHTHEEGTGHVQ